MKLYEVPRNTMIELEGREYFFHHIDGAYSLCYDVDGNIVHISANAEVKIKRRIECLKRKLQKKRKC
jgi:hypothetical protein